LRVGPAHESLTSALGLTPGEAAVFNLAEDACTVREAVSRAAGGGIAMADALRAIFIGLCAGALQAPGWPPRALTTSQVG
jgi:hypothetical protein